MKFLLEFCQNICPRVFFILLWLALGSTQNPAQGASTLPLIACSYNGSTLSCTNGGWAISVDGGTSSVPFTASVVSGGSWLSVRPLSGTIPVKPAETEISITVTPGMLSTGTYSGMVKIDCGASSCPITGQVTLGVSNATGGGSGGGGGTGGGGTPTRTISVSTPALSFTSDPASPWPPTQSIVVRSSPASGDLAVTASDSGRNWLSVTTQGGLTTQATVTVLANTDGLSPGVYNGTITITSTGASNSPLKVPVTLTVSSNMSFTYQTGTEAPKAKCFTFNGDADGQKFTVSTSGETWLGADPLSGTTPRNICVSVNPKDLIAGEYTGTVTISASAGSLSLKVSLTVSPASKLLATPSSLTFRVQPGARPPSQKISVSSENPGRGLSFTASADSDRKWLTISAAGGSTPADLTVDVNPDGLSAGTYNGTVTISSSGAVGSPQRMPVTLTVPDIRLSVLPTSVSFDYDAGAAAPIPKPILVSSSDTLGNDVLLAFTASLQAALGDGNSAAGTGWLTVTNIGAKTPGTVLLSINPGKMTKGTYNATVNISAPGASNSPQSVVVSLSVRDPKLVIDPTKVSFNYQLGAPTPSSKTVRVKSSGAALNYTASSSTDGNTSWISVRRLSAESLSISVDPRELSKGTYNGTVRVEASGAANSPALIPVALTVRDRPTLLARPIALSFSYQRKFQNPPPQTVAISGGTTKFTVSTSPGNGWLSVDSMSGTSPATLNISVAPRDLSAGTYNGAIKIESPESSNTPLTIPVSLTVTDGPRPAVSPDSVSLDAQIGSIQAVSADVFVSTNGDQFRFATSTSGEKWLSVNPALAVAGTINVSTQTILPTQARITISANPQGLTVGTYSGKVFLTSDNASYAPVVIPVSFSVHPNNLIISQVADGGNWKTTITLINTDNESAPFTLKFWRPDGQPLVLPLAGIGNVAEYSDTIRVGGSRTIETASLDASVTQGWAEVIAAKSISGTAIFRQRGAGDQDSEAAVPITPPLGKRFLLPFDNTNGFVTAMALANPNASQQVSFSITLRDENGQLISTESLTLPPHNRLAFSLRDQFPRLADRRGVAEFSTASQDVAALGLRFNPRAAFTSFEAVPLQQAPSSEAITRSISQIADGGNWKTTITLVNNGAEPAPFSLSFWQADGAPLSLPVDGLGPVTEYSDVIPVGGSRTLETEGTASTLLQGWAELVTSKSIGGTTVFRQRSQGEVDSEAGVAIAPPLGRRFAIPFDNTQGFVTALALLNQNATTSGTVFVTFRDENGSPILSDSITLGPHSRQAFALPDRYNVLKERRGTAEFSSAELSALGLRFNPRAAFTSIAPAKK